MNREPKIDNTSTNPAPSLEWKPIAETLDELRAMGDTMVLFFRKDGMVIHDNANSSVLNWDDRNGRVFWMPVPPAPKPTPTIAELERAVVEAVDAMKRHGVYAKGSLEDVLITRHDALLAHRERAKNNSGDAAGV